MSYQHKHTPAPWGVEPFEIEGEVESFFIRGDLAASQFPYAPFVGAKHVAHVDWNESSNVHAQSQEEAEANARLIASAPLLYDQLCRAARVMNEVREELASDDVELSRDNEKRIEDLGTTVAGSVAVLRAAIGADEQDAVARVLAEPSDAAEA